MPLRTFERWVEGESTVVVSKVGYPPFNLPPSRAARILGITRETVECETKAPDEPVGDAALLALARNVTSGRVFGPLEPGERTLTDGPHKGQVTFAYSARDGLAYREMVLSIPNNPPRV